MEVVPNPAGVVHVEGVHEEETGLLFVRAVVVNPLTHLAQNGKRTGARTVVRTKKKDSEDGEDKDESNTHTSTAANSNISNTTSNTPNTTATTTTTTTTTTSQRCQETDFSPLAQTAALPGHASTDTKLLPGTR